MTRSTTKLSRYKCSPDRWPVGNEGALESGVHREGNRHMHAAQEEVTADYGGKAHLAVGPRLCVLVLPELQHPRPLFSPMDRPQLRCGDREAIELVHGGRETSGHDISRKIACNLRQGIPFTCDRLYACRARLAEFPQSRCG